MERLLYGAGFLLCYLPENTQLYLHSSSAIRDIIDFCRLKPLVRGCASFFFDGSNYSEQPELLAHHKLTRSLVSQLCDRCDNATLDALAELYHACDNGHRQPSHICIEDTLLRVLEGFEDVYIVMDSLDVYTGRASILKWIQSVTLKTSGKLHLMITSHPDQEIKRSLAALSGSSRLRLQHVSITDQATESDIKLYLDTELAQMDQWNDVDKQIIKDSLLSRSDGM